MPDPLRILIVEDEVLIALALQIELSRAGYEVCGITAHAEDAVRKAIHMRPDVILMDIGLAGEMNGFGAARLILEQYPVPILFVSGYIDEETRGQVRELTALPCLSKPVMLKQLKEALRPLQA
jgi:DNA-binding response OmpR family regulator